MRRMVSCASTLGAGTILGALHWGSAPSAGMAFAAAGVAATAPAWLLAGSVVRRDRELAELRRVAETVQRALLRPVPRRVGDLRADVRYLAADARATVGGDLYDVLDTPYGTRLIIGDVSGKGLAAVARAADVLGAFRELARHEPSLSGVAVRLDALVRARPADDEGFVTALLMGLPSGDGPAEIVYCGHPPPLLLRDGTATFPVSLAPAPPLGLLDLADGWCAAEPLPVRPGDRLLFYTDGVIEARDAAGRDYPLAQRAADLMRRDADTCLGPFLERLEDDLLGHTGGRLDDDAALLLVEVDRLGRLGPVAALPELPELRDHVLGDRQ
ncbi:PP2C family protein-serine/threonine phosphatase [Thermomonospora umbrina]|uniref:Stage II sporulation protein E n=1 Tax=Thermomonospora umbrina TaxID=111806 RepID=A0A3D9SSL2_9ACTN|nr:PP2C family protein-serine/threonine phosphatase [Thermomonospora umbrina]REE98788.1 stage II sporulation protein E [Thermomonospora umbrina]